MGEELEVVNVAIEDLNATISTELDAVEPEELERQAQEAKDHQNWLLATELWSRLVTEFQPSLRGSLELAIAQRESGQLLDSLETLQQAETKYGVDCWISDNRARAYLALGDKSAATDHWRTAMEHSPGEEVRENFERMIQAVIEEQPAAASDVRAHSDRVQEQPEQRKTSTTVGLLDLPDGGTARLGIVGSRLWLLAKEQFDGSVLELATDEGVIEKNIQWYAGQDAFLYQILKNSNLLPNPTFQSVNGNKLEGWVAEAIGSSAVDVDFSERFKLEGVHVAYLFAPAGAPRPCLGLKNPVPIRADMGFNYRFTGFFSSHRADGELEIEFMDTRRNIQSRELLKLSHSDDYPGGSVLSDYQWIEWSIRPPLGAEFANLRIRLGQHNGEYPDDSFLFLTLPSFGVADTQPEAWQPACPDAGRLLSDIRETQWQCFGILDFPPDTKRVKVSGQTLDLDEGEARRLSGLNDPKLALAGAMQVSVGGPVWLACRWPVSGTVRVSHPNGQESAGIEGLSSQGEFHALALRGQNLLPNSDFSDGLDHWQIIPDAGVDFGPAVKPTGGHAAYIFRKAETENEVTRMYMDSLPLPAGISSMQLSGLFGYHRCQGYLGIEWLDGLCSVIGENTLHPQNDTARGEKRLSDYDLQEARLSVPDGVTAVRVFVEKTVTQRGQKDSFLFFTRLLLAPVDAGRMKWRKAAPDCLGRVIRFGQSANYFQRLDGFFQSKRMREITFPDGGKLEIQGPELIETTPRELEFRVRGVVNGNFESCGSGLTQVSSLEDFTAADNWRILNPAHAGISVSATRLRTRDPRLGKPGELVHALDIAFPEAGEQVELVGVVVTEGLEPRKAASLRLYLTTSGAEPYGCLESVDLLIGKEHTVNLARRVQFGAAGRYFEFRIPVTDAEQLRGSAEPVYLRLDLGLSNHLTLADVSFTSLAEEKPQNDPLSPVFNLEDPNLESQVERIKLTENWGKSSLFECVSRYAPLSSEPRVEIIVPVFNALEETLDCLQSIRINTTVPYALTVIDDASEPDVAQALKAYQHRNPGLNLLRNESNLGYTRTANIGFAHAQAEWVVLLNSDTIVTPRWLEGLLECAASEPEIKFVGPLSNAATWQSVPAVFDITGKFKVNALPSGYTPADMGRLVEMYSWRAYPRVKLLNGFCTLIHRQTVIELGLLDEMGFPQGYGEENDLCLRAAAAGHQLAIADHVYVYHAKSASFGHVRRNTLSKAGGDVLRRKHPNVDLARVQADIAESPALIRLRQDLRAHLEGNP